MSTTTTVPSTIDTSLFSSQFPTPTTTRKPRGKKAAAEIAAAAADTAATPTVVDTPTPTPTVEVTPLAAYEAVAGKRSFDLAVELAPQFAAACVWLSEQYESMEKKSYRSLATPTTGKSTVPKYILIGDALRIGGDQPDHDGFPSVPDLFLAAINAAGRKSVPFDLLTAAVAEAASTADAYARLIAVEKPAAETDGEGDDESEGEGDESGEPTLGDLLAAAANIINAAALLATRVGVTEADRDEAAHLALLLTNIASERAAEFVEVDGDEVDTDGE